jgi:chromosome partitioning protein
MKSLAIINEKGGVGKTIVTVNLGVTAEAHGLTTTIFDLDPRANSAMWGDARNRPPEHGQPRTEPIRPPEVTPAQAARLPLLLKQAREQGADLILIDTPGGPGTGAEIGEEAAEAADAILIPCCPAGPDLKTLARSLRVARRSGKPFFVVMTDAPAQGPETAETIASVTASGVKVCPVVLHTRKAYTRRFQEGLAAHDIEPRGKAAAEMRELLLWICEKVINVTTYQDNEVTTTRAKVPA